MREAPRSSRVSPSMSDLLIRALVVGGGAAAAVAIGLLARRRRSSKQPPVRVEGLALEAAVVAFTSTDCSNCKEVMRRLSRLSVPVREVAYELEPALFEAAGVEAVPLVVIVTPEGARSQQFGGLVELSRLRRALSRAGW